MDFTSEEKEFVVRELAKKRSVRDIAHCLGRGFSTIYRYIKNPGNRKIRKDKGTIKCVSKHQLLRLKRQTKEKPYATSKNIFQRADCPEISRQTRCRILRKFAVVSKPLKRPPLSKRHRSLRVNWAKKYCNCNFDVVIFTDECRVTLDGPDGWASGWTLSGDKKIGERIRRQQGGGSIMIWAGIVKDEVIGPFLIPDGVKMNAKIYCKFLDDNFFPWLEEVPLAKRRRLIFMQDNAPSHRSQFTSNFLQSIGICRDSLMEWPPNSPDLNPIENLWSIIKQRLYCDGQQYHSKEQVWKAIEGVCQQLTCKEIMNLTQGMKDRLLNVYAVKGRYIEK